MKKPIIGVTPSVDEEKNRCLVQPGYLESIHRAGGLGLMLPLTDRDEDIARFIEVCDGFLFVGGPDIEPWRYGQELLPECGPQDKERDAMEWKLLEAALAADKPVLGVCRGIQILNTVLGGTLYQDIPSQYETTLSHAMPEPLYNRTAHGFRVVEGTPLAELPVCEGVNSLEVEVEDTLDRELAYGKQTYKRGGMWYTAISGIWQPVWLEGRAEISIEDMKITPDLRGVDIMTVGGEAKKHISVTLPNGTLELDYEGDRVRVDIPEPLLWTPETPHLYDFVLSAGEDRIESYFALRTVSIGARSGRSYILLNGEPYFFHGLLDQGYYSDGIYTPATPEGYRYDILKMKELGFNMLRKHIKIEPDVFYYYCDKYGMIVFQDMVNSGKYSFLIDTALPTVALRSKVTHKASKRRREHFERSSRETVDLLYNHPCVCYYTIFNEGWGQYDADRIYCELKEYDPTRVWDATSGWFRQKYSDVVSEHIYFKKVKLKSDPARPLVLSEFGGYSMRVEGHSFNLDKAYGYKTLEDSESLSAAIEELYLDQIVPEIEKNGLCATVLTQVSDVEDEINGLLTYDRKVLKVDALKMQSIAENLKRKFFDISR